MKQTIIGAIAALLALAYLAFCCGCTTIHVTAPDGTRFDYTSAAGKKQIGQLEVTKDGDSYIFKMEGLKSNQDDAILAAIQAALVAMEAARAAAK